MGDDFRLHHGSATTEKAAQAAGRVEAIVGDVVNGNRRAWGRIDVEDVALLVQHARDAAASPDWLSKMAIDTLVTRWETAKAERDAATARAEAAEQRAEAAEAEVARLRADRKALASMWLMTLPPVPLATVLPSEPDAMRVLGGGLLDVTGEDIDTAGLIVYMRDLLARMLAEAQPAGEVADG